MEFVLESYRPMALQGLKGAQWPFLRLSLWEGGGSCFHSIPLGPTQPWFQVREVLLSLCPLLKKKGRKCELLSYAVS